ncbi:MAG: glycosyltransferase [candidate division WOR-3 bacterium]|nr:MAG: glycosyltransferase [candidate division WOR-3 bacterium]
MRLSLDHYRKIVGDTIISDIYKQASGFYKRKILHINSTFYGGGVAEILSALVPLMNDVGIAADWRMLRGSPDFFNMTKKFHNALQGGPINLTDMKRRVYIQTMIDFASYCQIDQDCVIIHDPQPLPLIKFYTKTQPWIWRIHIDLSSPNEELWDFLKEFILKYDNVILSSKEYRRKDLPVEQRIIPPAIDPLSVKNKDINGKTILKYLKKFNIPTDKPIISQVSRFDKWKDPVGVIETFKMVKEKVDCRLVLCGSSAIDDPESHQMFTRVKRRINNFIRNNDVILITSDNNILVNVIQRSSAVIVQKSIREGFGLSVTEALWKKKPVVASDVGGIRLQIKDGESGFLVDPQDNNKFAERIGAILKDPKLGESLGERGHDFVKKNFLITRLLLDYLNLLKEIMRA